MYSSLFSALVLAVGANAATHIITVGEGGSLDFKPNSLTAAVGDTLEFHFYSGSGSHSVVSSTFDSPCVPETGAFFSGYQQADSTGDTTFVVTVTSTDPIWFYCSLASHCQLGMAGVVNPPSGETVTDYVKAAQKVSQASAPSSITGGVLTIIKGDATIISASSSTVRTGIQASTSSSINPGGPIQTASESESGSSSVRTGVHETTSNSINPGGPIQTGSSSESESSVRTGVQATSTSSGATGTATTTKSEARQSSDMSIVLGLGVVVGGLVVLMA